MQTLPQEERRRFAVELAGIAPCMGDYEESTTVRVEPNRLFEYLADIENLPAYLPRLSSARPTSGNKVEVTAHINPPDGPERDVQGEAWMKVVEHGKKLQWGASGPHDYRGELDVDAGPDRGTSSLTVRLHTDRVEGDQITTGLRETLNGLKSAVELAESH